MSPPRFTILARVDDTRFISACPHGVAHLTWERLTLRLRLDEFEALAGLLARAAAEPGRALRDERVLPLAFSPGDPRDVQVGAAVLRLAPAEFRQLAAAVAEARRRLAEIAAGGEWDEPDEPPRADPLDGLTQSPFSRN